MERIEYKKCESCGKALATKVGGKQYDCCLEHCSEAEKNKISQAIQGRNCRESILDASQTVDGYRYYSLGVQVPQDADFTGSIFSNIDFSSQDLTRIDFSFCSFDECDFRRARLFNSSLLWAIFSQSVMRQVDINNSDCRWMCASAKKRECEGELKACLASLANSKSKHRMSGFGRYFGHRYSVEFNDDEVKLFDRGKYSMLLERISESDHGNGDCFIGREISDWSGSSLRGSDFAHANFDNAKVQETSFDGSDLHAASFRNSELQRSVFTDVSFSRILKEQPLPSISNFDEANMEECSFAGGNLSGLYFKNVKFAYSDFKNAHFDNAVFWKCDLRSINAESVIANDCKFFGSNMSGSSFLAATLNRAAFHLKGNETGLAEGCKEATELLAEWRKGSPTSSIVASNFHAVEMEAADLTGIRARAVNMMAANLEGTCFCNAECRGAQFESSNIAGSRFDQADLTGCNLRDCNIAGEPLTFDRTVLKDAIMSGMEIEKVRFVDCDMEGIMMADCKLYEVEIKRVELDGKINMRRSSLRGSSIAGLKCSDVDIASSDLSYAVSSEKNNGINGEKCIVFDGCSLKSCNMEGVLFYDTVFSSCNIKNSNIANAHLERVEFSNSNIDSCNFSGAELTAVAVEGDHHQFSALDFTDAVLTDCRFCGDQNFESSHKYATTITLDYAEVDGLLLEHISFASMSARFSNLKIAGSTDVVFSSSDFSSASVVIEKVHSTHFFYDKFPSALVKLQNIANGECPSVFLGCDFKDAEIRDGIKAIVFADCIFSYSDMLSSPDLVDLWAKAFLISPTLENLKYCSEKGWLKGFLENSRKTVENNLELLNGARNLRTKFSIAERLGTLIPDEHQLKRDEGYGLLEPLCRALKIDFRQQNLHSCASDAYVKERFCGIQLAARSTECYLLKSLLIKCGSVTDFKVYSSFVAICLFIFILPSLWLLGAAVVAFFAGLTLRSKFWRDLFGRHLYRHGESFGRILGSSLMVILFFGVCYLAFVPEFDSKTNVMIRSNDLAADENAKTGENEFWVKVAFSLRNNADDIRTKHILAGGIKDGDALLTSKGDLFDRIRKLGVCLYFSGVTFTTLGYGDISPQGVVRALAMSESGIGAFLIALFVFAYTRRDV